MFPLSFSTHCQAFIAFNFKDIDLVYLAFPSSINNGIHTLLLTCQSHLHFYCFLAYLPPARPFNSWLYENVFHTSTFISFFLLFPVLETGFSFSFGGQIPNLRSFILNNTYPMTPYLTILVLISFILLIFVVLMYHLYLLLWDLICFYFLMHVSTKLWKHPYHIIFFHTSTFHSSYRCQSIDYLYNFIKVNRLLIEILSYFFCIYPRYITTIVIFPGFPLLR